MLVVLVACSLAGSVTVLLSLLYWLAVGSFLDDYHRYIFLSSTLDGSLGLSFRSAFFDTVFVVVVGLGAVSKSEEGEAEDHKEECRSHQSKLLLVGE